MNLESLFPENLYHSYIVEGDVDVLGTAVRNLLQDRGDILPQSLDVFFNAYDAFTIADSAAIKEWHSSKPLSEGKKVCIISARFINHEAQQSLLKMLEEPEARTHFFLIVPHGRNLLDTIRSRTHTIRVSDESPEPGISKQFISAPLPKKLDLIAALIDKHKDSEGSGGLRHEATQLINELERSVYQKFHAGATDAHTQLILGEIKNAREYLSVPGCSVKMILEHIALMLF
jgi:hypothetical protein